MINEVLTDKLRKVLDEMGTDSLRRAYGDPSRTDLRYLDPAGGHWRQGHGRPSLVAESPAVAQAIGRCAASRIRFSGMALRPHAMHPTTCGWCDFPLDVLLAACDHAAFVARCIDVELLVWVFEGGREYARSTGRTGEYDNPEWRDFFALPVRGRASLVAEASR